MKKCSYCAEEIQDAAIKCRFCGEFLNNKPKDKWYFKTSSILIAFFFLGPFVLPVIWLNPKFNIKKKIIISLIVLLLTYFLGIWLVKYIKNIVQYYNLLSTTY